VIDLVSSLGYPSNTWVDPLDGLAVIAGFVSGGVGMATFTFSAKSPDSFIPRSVHERRISRTLGHRPPASSSPE
jgi:hypothetical protein